MSRRHRQILHQTGITPESKPVMGGVFKLLDTYGIPLDVIVGELQDNGFMVDWINYIEDAEKAGWDTRRTVLQLAETVSDIYGKEFREEWTKRIATYLKHRSDARIG